MKKLKDLFFNKMTVVMGAAMCNRQLDQNEDNTLTKKKGFNDYVASVILLIISVVIGLKFKTELIAQFSTIFTWWGTNMNTLTSTN